MKKGKLLDYLIYIPFLAALAFFIIFIRYYFIVNGSSEITSIMNLYLIRCRNMAVFCLILGIFLLIIKNIILLFTIDKKDNIYNTNDLSRISNRQEFETKTYSLTGEKVVNDILKDKIVNVNFLNSNIEDREMKFNNYNEKNNSISLIDLKRGNKFYDSRYFIKCCKCDEIISKNAEKCKYCGSIQNEIKTKKFNPIIFAVNMIIILLCIIVMVLVVHKIVEQRNINLSNINIKTVETK